MSSLDRLVLFKLYDMTKSNAINDGVIKELLATVKSLQADMVELKSGATGGSNLLIDQSGRATLPSNGSKVSGNPRKRRLSGEAMDLSEGSDKGDDAFRLSKEDNAFIEAAFKSRFDDTARGKKNGLPESKWLKSPQLDSFYCHLYS